MLKLDPGEEISHSHMEQPQPFFGDAPIAKPENNSILHHTLVFFASYSSCCLASKEYLSAPWRV
jgi:hypothetical protein